MGFERGLAFKAVATSACAPRRGDHSGSALIECVLTLPILFALTYGLITIGMMLWQGQRSATLAREAANYVLKQCMRRPGALLDLTNLYQCFDQAAVRINALPELGLHPARQLTYRGQIAGFGVTTPVVPVRTVFITCRNWVAVDTGTGMECNQGSSDCIRRCGDPSIVPPVPPDPSMIEVRDSARPGLLVPDAMKIEMWNRYGPLIERRSFIIVSEVASGYRTQGGWSADMKDLYETVVF